MDWAVGLAFPCQQPMLHANGVTDIPKFRISPDYFAKLQSTDTWQDGENGGLLGITDLLLRASVMSTYLSEDWGSGLGGRCGASTPSSTPSRPRSIWVADPLGVVVAGPDPDRAVTESVYRRVRLGQATLTRVVELRAQMRTSLFGQTPGACVAGERRVAGAAVLGARLRRRKIAIQT